MENDRAAEYRAYLKSDVWQRLRAQALARSNGLCHCGKVAIEVHHVRYPKRFGDEEVNDLAAVCQTCHEAAHGKLHLVVLDGATPLRKFSLGGKPFPYLVCANARVWSTLEEWCKSLQIPSSIRTRFEVAMKAVIGKEPQYQARSEKGVLVYRYHAAEQALEGLEFEWRVQDMLPTHQRTRWTEDEQAARDDLHRNYRALRKWANDLQEEAIAGKLQERRTTPDHGLTPQAFIDALKEAVAPRLHQHDEKIAAHDIVIEAVKQAAPFLRDGEEFVSLRQAAMELGLDPAWMPRHPESRLNVCGLAGRALSQKGVELGPKIASRLDGSASTAEMNTYRRSVAYAALRDASAKPGDLPLFPSQG